MRQPEHSNVGNGTPRRPGTQSNLNTQPLTVTTPLPGQLSAQQQHKSGQLSAQQHKRPLVPIFLTFLVLLLVSVFVFVGMNLDSLLPATPPREAAHAENQVAPPVSAIVGHVFFMSSGQVNESTSQGIADEVQLELSHISSPAQGNSLYAWLVGDNPAEGGTLLLGTLNVNKGNAQL
ncbi:MAG TPA: hypothetical protein VKU38_20720, partial [Ktedonobacteraceae bacterium]|nr:hypothetical protein [Ktedonobacteraceae bacterium]